MKRDFSKPAFGETVKPMTIKEGRAVLDRYIIEVNSRTAGIVVRNPKGYCFFASSNRFNRLEGQLFRNAREAERAAHRLVGGDVKEAA